jgi:hypothetical protein
LPAKRTAAHHRPIASKLAPTIPVGAGLLAKRTTAHHRPIASKLAPTIPVGAGLPAKRTAARRSLIASKLALTTLLWEAAPGPNACDYAAPAFAGKPAPTPPAVCSRFHATPSPVGAGLPAKRTPAHHRPIASKLAPTIPVGAGLPAKRTAAHHRPIASKLAPTPPVGAGLPAKRTAARRSLIASKLALTTLLWETAPGPNACDYAAPAFAGKPAPTPPASAHGFTRHPP